MISYNSIKELNFLDDIDSIEETYRKAFGVDAFNISNWNSSNEFKKSIIDNLSLQNEIDNLDYIFSYEQTDTTINHILKKLGFSSKMATLFTHSGSASIFNVLNLLKMNGVKKLIILCPVYFTVIHGCEILNIDYDLVYLQRENNRYIFDEKFFEANGNKTIAYWITNPIYCTGVYYTGEQINLFKKISENNYIIIDESLCMLGCFIGPKIESKNMIGLYSPHKSICMNGIKFSLAVTNINFQNQFDAWSDVLCGCLSCSNQIAINHFISNNFVQYKKAFDEKVAYNFKKLRTLMDIYNVSYDTYAKGYLISLFFPNIDASQGLNLNFNKEVLFNTGVRFIPGIRNHFSKNMGFSFRVNLSALTSKSMFTVERLIKYLIELN